MSAEEIKLRQSEEKYRKLINSANDAIFIADVETGILIDANKKATELIGRPLNKIIGMHQSRLHPSKETKRYKNLFHEYVKKGEGVTSQLYVRHSSGKNIPVEISGSVVEVDGKKIMQGIFRDISERKRIDELKTEFLSIASHELKTPITTLKLLVSAAARKYESKVEDKYFQTVNKELDRLTALINELLDISRIETQKLSLDIKSADMVALIKEVIKKIKLLYPKRRIIYKGLEKLTIPLDSRRIEQVLINLLTNAIRYSPETSAIKITVGRRKGKVIVFVQDKGMGIAKSKLPHVFDRFYQVNNLVSKGFGLGLYITKKIIEQHKGKICVKSKEKKGSTFYFSLPYRTS